MKLTEIQLRQFRQFEEGWHADALEPGINIFHGPNESGKTTVVQAIRAAFFERHSSGTLAAFQPWGDSAAAPEVALAFKFEGRRYHLSKRFMRQRRCHLSIDGHALSGDDAEEHLAGLLGFTVPARGASRPEQWGVPGLLWIEQGGGQDLQQPVTHAYEHLQSMLNQALGHVASSDGDALLQKVNERLARLQTDKTAAPTQEYKKAVLERQQLEDEHRQLGEAIEQYRDHVDRFAALQHEHARDQASPPWESLRAQQATARQALEQVHAWRREQARQREALDACRKTQALLQQQLLAFDTQKKNVQERDARLVLAQQKHQELAAQSVALESEQARARSAFLTARQAVVDGRQARQRRVYTEELARIQREWARMRTQREQAGQTQALLVEARARVAAMRVNPAALKELRAAHERLQALEIRQEALATRLELALLPGQSVTIDGHPVSGREKRLLLTDTAVDIPGVGHIRIMPGGYDVAGLAQDYHAARAEWDAGLQRLAVASLQEAQDRAAEYDELTANIGQYQQILKLHAPEGVETLQMQIEELQREQERLRAELDALPSPQSGHAAPAEDDATQAQARETHAERRLRDAEERLQAHRIALAAAQTALDAAGQEAAHARRQFEDGRRRDVEQHTIERLHEEQLRQRELEQTLDTYQERIAAVHPDMLEQDILRLGRSADQLQEASAERERSLRELQGRLQAEGAQGLEERRNQIAGRLAMAERRVAEFARQAAALSLLQTLLQEQRSTLTRKLHAPLQGRLAHYLNILFPGAAGSGRIALDDGLAPVSLTRRTVAEALPDLSFGTREQIGLISRLAYADLLKEAGKPTLIILDDALVHSDESRLAPMKRILFDAAQRHQILLFTCQPEKWRDLGVMPRAIADLRA